MIKLKRVYETPSQDDGMRILVDRIWPRGLTKDEAKIDLWLKEVAPSAALRTWFGHDPARWKEFCERYWKELEDKPDLIGELRKKLSAGTVTFVYAARGEAHNNAVALKAFLESRKR